MFILGYDIFRSLHYRHMSTESFVHEYCKKLQNANVNTLPDLFAWALEFPEDQIDPEHTIYFNYLKYQIVALIKTKLEHHILVEDIIDCAASIIANLGEATGINPPSPE